MSEHDKAKLAVFEGKQIRKVLHEGAWWFAIVDVVGRARLSKSLAMSTPAGRCICFGRCGECDSTPIGR
jgi:hypothetical protein